MSRCHFCEIFLPRTFVRSVTEVRYCEDYSYCKFCICELADTQSFTIPGGSNNKAAKLVRQ